MNHLDLLKGKKIELDTDVGVKVVVEIKSIKENWHSEDLEPATKANDWYPNQRTWNTYTIFLSTGKFIQIYSLSELKIVE